MWGGGWAAVRSAIPVFRYVLMCVWGGGAGERHNRYPDHLCIYSTECVCVCVWGGGGGGVLYYYDIAADSTYVVTDVTQSLIYWAVLITGQM